MWGYFTFGGWDSSDPVTRMTLTSSLSPCQVADRGSSIEGGAGETRFRHRLGFFIAARGERINIFRGDI